MICIGSVILLKGKSMGIRFEFFIIQKSLVSQIILQIMIQDSSIPYKETGHNEKSRTSETVGLEILHLSIARPFLPAARRATQVI